jgi:exo-1,4-beta-D-glucosaminidase
MLNNGWPSLHWNQFDYYFHPGGSFFGTKTGARVEHVAYDYAHKEIWLINHSLSQKGSRTIEAELIDLNGQVLWSHNVTTDTETNSAKKVVDVDNMDKIKDVAFLRLQLTQGRKTLSRNVYWLGKQVDALNWANSTWYTTPVTDYVDYTALGTMKPANVTMRVGRVSGAPHLPGTKEWSVVLENHSEVAAFFISLNLVDAEGSDVTPVLWSDNYVTLWPHEKLTLTAAEWGSRGASIHVKGVNVKAVDVRLH